MLLCVLDILEDNGCRVRGSSNLHQRKKCHAAVDRCTSFVAVVGLVSRTERQRGKTAKYSTST